jgi:sec-independent protein translocase protein TatA
MPGPLELLVIAMIILLLFGNRLPSVMRSMGKGIVEFKKGVQGIEDEMDQAANKSDDASADGPSKSSGDENQPA